MGMVYSCKWKTTKNGKLCCMYITEWSDKHFVSQLSTEKHVSPTISVLVYILKHRLIRSGNRLNYCFAISGI